MHFFMRIVLVSRWIKFFCCKKNFLVRARIAESSNEKTVEPNLINDSTPANAGGAIGTESESYLKKRIFNFVKKFSFFIMKFLLD